MVFFFKKACVVVDEVFVLEQLVQSQGYFIFNMFLSSKISADFTLNFRNPCNLLLIQTVSIKGMKTRLKPSLFK